MKLLAYSLILPLVLGEQFVVPAVESDVDEALSRCSKYTAYNGPTGTAAAQVVSSSAAAVPARAAVNAAPASTIPYPYWYETITHQGKAAFNSNSSYIVFRNVKSAPYNAKGYVAINTCCNKN